MPGWLSPRLSFHESQVRALARGCTIRSDVDSDNLILLLSTNLFRRHGRKSQSTLHSALPIRQVYLSPLSLVMVFQQHRNSQTTYLFCLCVEKIWDPNVGAELFPAPPSQIVIWRQTEKTEKTLSKIIETAARDSILAACPENHIEIRNHYRLSGSTKADNDTNVSNSLSGLVGSTFNSHERHSVGRY